jgi:para-aminobenzoate synthetase/4-amino-4-deoxychorismate lyase
VADSDPLAEARECTTKAAPLLAAIGARAAGAAGRSAPAAPRRTSPRPVSRPEPAAGVFETILVAGGRPVALGRHLTRLALSARQLYGAGLPVGLAAELFELASGVGRARLRVTARPRRAAREGKVELELELTGLPERSVPVELVPRAVAGGLGAHKWVDRRLLDSLAAPAPGEDEDEDEDEESEALLCDLDGLVLETARGNVFVVDRQRRLLTPPADGRILPGVTRARVLEHARVLGLQTRVRPLALEELNSARELLVTGSLRGVVPARLDGHPPEVGPTGRRLARALERERTPVTA